METASNWAETFGKREAAQEVIKEKVKAYEARLALENAPAEEAEQHAFNEMLAEWKREHREICDELAMRFKLREDSPSHENHEAFQQTATQYLFFETLIPLAEKHGSKGFGTVMADGFMAQFQKNELETHRERLAIDDIDSEVPAAGYRLAGAKKDALRKLHDMSPEPVKGHTRRQSLQGGAALAGAGVGGIIPAESVVERGMNIFLMLGAGAFSGMKLSELDFSMASKSAYTRWLQASERSDVIDQSFDKLLKMFDKTYRDYADQLNAGKESESAAAR